MSVADQFVTFDLSCFIVKSTLNIMQKAEIMSDFLYSDSSVADGVMRSSMHAGSCANMTFPGSPGSGMSFTST